MIQILFISLQELNGCHNLQYYNVWNFNQPCIISQILDYKEKQKVNEVNISYDLDNSVINIKNLTLTQNCTYYFMDIWKTGQLKNLLIFVNVSLTVPKSCQAINISIIGTLNGSLHNVSFFGYVNISSEVPLLYINIYNSFINTNNEQIVDTCNSIEVQYNNQLKHSTINSMNNFSIKQCQEINNSLLQQQIYENNQSMFIYIPEENNISSIFNQKRYNQQLEFNNDIKKAQHIDLNEFYQQTNDSKLAFYRIYFQVFKTIITIKNNLTIITLSDDKIYDIHDDIILISQQKCKFANFYRVCLNKCPLNFYLHKKTCWPYIPYYLGVIYNDQINETITCQNQMASDQNYCINKCSQEQNQFKNGCYTKCPEYAIQKNNTCLIPQQQDDCKEGYYISQQIGGNQFLDQKLCLNITTNDTIYSIIPDDAINQCNKNQVAIFIDQNSYKCSYQCDSTYFDQNGICKQECDILYTKIQSISSCVRCADNSTGGMFYDIQNKICMHKCLFYNKINNSLYCDILGSSTCLYVYFDQDQMKNICSTNNQTKQHEQHLIKKNSVNSNQEILFHGNNTKCILHVVDQHQYVCKTENQVIKTNSPFKQIAKVTIGDDGSYFQTSNGRLYAMLTEVSFWGGSKRITYILNNQRVFYYSQTSVNHFISDTGQLYCKNNTELVDLKGTEPAYYAFPLRNQQLAVITNEAYTVNNSEIDKKLTLPDGTSVDPTQILNFHPLNDGAYFEYKNKYYFIMDDLSLVYKLSTPPSFDYKFIELKLNLFSPATKIFKMQIIQQDVIVYTDANIYKILDISVPSVVLYDFQPIVVNSINEMGFVGDGVIVITDNGVYTRGDNSLGQLGTPEATLSTFTNNSLIQLSDLPLKLSTGKTQAVYYKPLNVYQLEGGDGQIFKITTKFQNIDQYFVILSGRFNATALQIEFFNYMFPLTIYTVCSGLDNTITLNCDISLKTLKLCELNLQQQIDALICETLVVTYDILVKDAFCKQPIAQISLQVFKSIRDTKQLINVYDVYNGQILIDIELLKQDVSDGAYLIFETNDPDQFELASVDHQIQQDNSTYIQFYNVTMSVKAIYTNISFNLTITDTYSGDLAVPQQRNITYTVTRINGSDQRVLFTDAVTFQSGLTQFVLTHEENNLLTSEYRNQFVKIKVEINDDNNQPLQLYFQTVEEISLHVYTPRISKQIIVLKQTIDMSLLIQLVDSRNRTIFPVGVQTDIIIDINGTQQLLETYLSSEKQHKFYYIQKFDDFVNNITFIIQTTDQNNIFNFQQKFIRTDYNTLLYNVIFELESNCTTLYFRTKSEDSLQNQITNNQIELSYINQLNQSITQSQTSDINGTSEFILEVDTIFLQSNNMLLNVKGSDATNTYLQTNMSIQCTSQKTFYFIKVVMLQTQFQIVVYSYVKTSKVQYLSDNKYTVKQYSKADKSDVQLMTPTNILFENNASKIQLPLNYKDIYIDDKQIIIQLTIYHQLNIFETQLVDIIIEKNQYIYNSSINVTSQLQQITFFIHVSDMYYKNVSQQNMKITYKDRNNNTQYSTVQITNKHTFITYVTNEEYNQSLEYTFEIAKSTFLQGAKQIIQTTRNSVVYNVSLILVSNEDALSININIYDSNDGSKSFLSGCRVVIQKYVNCTSANVFNNTINTPLNYQYILPSNEISSSTYFEIIATDPNYITQSKNVSLTQIVAYNVNFFMQQKLPIMATTYIVTNNKDEKLNNLKFNINYNGKQISKVTNVNGEFSFTDKKYNLIGTEINIQSEFAESSPYKQIQFNVENSSLGIINCIKPEKYQIVDLKLIITDRHNNLLPSILVQIASASGETISSPITNYQGAVIIHCNELQCGLRINEWFLVSINDPIYGQYQEAFVFDSQYVIKQIILQKIQYQLILLDSLEQPVEQHVVEVYENDKLIPKITDQYGKVYIHSDSSDTIQVLVPKTKKFKKVNKQNIQFENSIAKLTIFQYTVYELDVNFIPKLPIPSPTTPLDQMQIQLLNCNYQILKEYQIQDYHINDHLQENTDYYVEQETYYFKVRFINSDKNINDLLVFKFTPQDGVVNLTLYLEQNMTALTLHNINGSRIANYTIEILNNGLTFQTVDTNSNGQAWLIYQNSMYQNNELRYNIQGNDIYKPKLNRIIRFSEGINQVNIQLTDWIVYSLQFQIFNGRNKPAPNLKLQLISKTTQDVILQGKTNQDGTLVLISNEKDGFSFLPQRTYILKIIDEKIELNTHIDNNFKAILNQTQQIHMTRHTMFFIKYILYCILVILLLVGIISASVFSCCIKQMKKRIASEKNIIEKHVTVNDFEEEYQKQWIEQHKNVLKSIYKREITQVKLEAKQLKNQLSKRSVKLDTKALPVEKIKIDGISFMKFNFRDLDEEEVEWIPNNIDNGKQTLEAEESVSRLLETKEQYWRLGQLYNDIQHHDSSTYENMTDSIFQYDQDIVRSNSTVLLQASESHSIIGLL